MTYTKRILLKVNQILMMRNECNKSLIRATDETEFMHDVCKIVVQTGWYSKAWIGLAGMDENSPVRLVAQHGFGMNYLGKNGIAEDKIYNGGRTTETATRSGKSCTARDVTYDPASPVFRDCNLQEGDFSSIALPLQDEKRIFGVLGIYAPKPAAFDQKEIALIRDLANDLSHGIMWLRERSRLMQLERQLLQAQKMEAVGEIASGISHDFNNILSAIINYSFILRNKLKEDDDIINAIDNILSLSDRASRITKGLLAFGRKQNFEFVPAKLNDIIRDVEHLLSKFAGKNVKFKSRLSDMDPGIIADINQIEQVIINLVINARDSMPDGGILTVGTDIMEIDDDFIKAHGFGEPGVYAMLSISDTGTGMDEETRQRMFDPFFTTKRPDKGTGLGLSVAYGIIKQHNGYITVDSEPGKGSIFRIYFPAIMVSSKMEKTGNIPDIMGRSETILIAEDEIDIRSSMRTILEKFGYNVIEAESGRDAIEKFSVAKNEVHLIVIDDVMPGEKGREVFKIINNMKPGIRAIITSGHTEAFLQGKNVFDSKMTFLSKPVLPHHFLAKIREALGPEQIH